MQMMKTKIQHKKDILCKRQIYGLRDILCSQALEETVNP